MSFPCCFHWLCLFLHFPQLWIHQCFTQIRVYACRFFVKKLSALTRALYLIPTSLKMNLSSENYMNYTTLVKQMCRLHLKQNLPPESHSLNYNFQYHYLSKNWCTDFTSCRDLKQQMRTFLQIASNPTPTFHTYPPSCPAFCQSCEVTLGIESHVVSLVQKWIYFWACKFLVIYMRDTERKLRSWRNQKFILQFK